jgi:hypothetical protein
MIALRTQNPSAAAPRMRTHADAANEIANLFHELIDAPDQSKPLDDRTRIRPKIRML